MNNNEFLQLIDNEIQWRNDNKGDDKFKGEPHYCEGFIKGLEQAKLLYGKLLEVEPTT